MTQWNAPGSTTSAGSVTMDQQETKTAAVNVPVNTEDDAACGESGGGVRIVMLN